MLLVQLAAYKNIANRKRLPLQVPSLTSFYAYIMTSAYYIS